MCVPLGQTHDLCIANPMRFLNAEYIGSAVTPKVFNQI